MAAKGIGKIHALFDQPEQYRRSSGGGNHANQRSQNEGESPARRARASPVPVYAIQESCFFTIFSLLSEGRHGNRRLLVF